jgi:molecular chaperone DnaK
VARPWQWRRQIISRHSQRGFSGGATAGAGFEGDATASAGARPEDVVEADYEIVDDNK